MLRWFRLGQIRLDKVRLVIISYFLRSRSARIKVEQSESENATFQSNEVFQAAAMIMRGIP